MALEPCYRLCGCAVGAAVGDALGMPLEFGPRRKPGDLVREMRLGPLPACRFTDDTEMALALAESLLAHKPLDPADLAQRFLTWYRHGPRDVGIHTRAVLFRLGAGDAWDQAAQVVQQKTPGSAGNGSVMRCWPVALAHWREIDKLLNESRLQSRVTHPHADCVAACALVNAAIYYLVHGEAPKEAISLALDAAEITGELRSCVEAAPKRRREDLKNSGWVRHTLEGAVWALLTTDSFEEAVVQAVNLGNDADTTGAVAGALAGAAYGVDAIPLRWREALHGEWPLHSGRIWHATDFSALADQLSA